MVYAHPYSVKDLNPTDDRTPEKLLNHQNQTFEDIHMWLAPFVKTKKYAGIKETARVPNQVCISF